MPKDGAPPRPPLPYPVFPPVGVPVQACMSHEIRTPMHAAMGTARPRPAPSPLSLIPCLPLWVCLCRRA